MRSPASRKTGHIREPSRPCTRVFLTRTDSLDRLV